MKELLLWLLYLVPGALVVHLHLRRKQTRQERDRDKWEAAVKSGLTEPASLHPVVDPDICVGSGSCAKACPEHAIGLIDGKAQLVNPAKCIGHGACAASCPLEAIKLVFGTEKRGIDIPQVSPDFQTNVPGIFIAGELGGMGLVRKAAEQGRQAIDSIAKRRADGPQLDVVIVGAGPAGISATLNAMHHELRSITIEQEDDLGGTVYHYPRNKIVMTQPVQLALVGKVKMTEVLKEALLEFWHGIVTRYRVQIRFGERMESVQRTESGFRVKTSRGEYDTRNVLLAIGRRGTPRKLGVPGEELPKVVYRLIDPEQYRGNRVLVVGGGDSALEAAIALAGEPDTEVILSYRGEAFGRVKEKNRERLGEAQAAGRLKVILKSNVEAIEADAVVLRTEGGSERHANDAVIVSAGGVLPTLMLKEMGIQVETRHGEA
ncbi:MAG: hypothetical protein OHK0026_05720 [Rhodocyclaceae bacterium]